MKPLSPEEVALAETVVTQVVNWYARRVWWIERADLTQEAWTGALECFAYGLDLSRASGYLHKTISRRLSRYCWEWSSPVSDPKPGPHLVTAQRAAMPDGEELAASENPETSLLKQEAALLVPNLRVQLRRRFFELYTEQTSLPAPNPEITSIVRVLVDGWPPSLVARQAGMTSEKLYASVCQWKQIVSNDDTVRLLTANLRERRQDLYDQ